MVVSIKEDSLRGHSKSLPPRWGRIREDGIYKTTLNVHEIQTPLSLYKQSLLSLEIVEKSFCVCVCECRDALIFLLISNQGWTKNKGQNYGPLSFLTFKEGSEWKILLICVEPIKDKSYGLTNPTRVSCEKETWRGKYVCESEVWSISGVTMISWGGG